MEIRIPNMIMNARGFRTGEDMIAWYPGTHSMMRKTRARTMASRRLLAGPARETMALSLRGDLKLTGLTGTGLAHPKRTPVPEMDSMRGTRTVPTGSMCLMGLRVTLPMSFAV